MKNHALPPSFRCTVLSALLLTCSSLNLLATEAKVFPTPDEAVSALGWAVNTTNRIELGAILGSDSEYLVNPDEVQGTAELVKFSAAFTASNRLVRESDTRMILEIGKNDWPFPIPLVKNATGWQYDTRAGLEELINRRIGRNELDVLAVMRGFVNAQREYASRDRDGDSVLEFAQLIGSNPGRTDGLYWPPALNGEISPIGPFVARAQVEGYFRDSTTSREEALQPFHGYLFKVLKCQGKHAPGGKYDYVINGNMIGGFALVAWPAEHGESGVMTFIVNQQGRVLQRDLGKDTARIVRKMKAFDPDSGWRESED